MHNRLFDPRSLNTKSLYISSIIVEKKQRSLAAEKNGKIITKVEPKESSKIFATCKTAQIRETRTSRLRAASIVVPNGM